MPKKINPELLERIVKDATLRRAVTRQSHFWFFHVFLSSYIEYPIALFHEEMFKLTEDKTQKLVAVIAFRGSGKSTIMNLSYSLWAVLDVKALKRQFADKNIWGAEYLLNMCSPTARPIPLCYNLRIKENDGLPWDNPWEKEPRQMGSYRISAPIVYGRGIPLGGHPYLKTDEDGEDE